MKPSVWVKDLLILKKFNPLAAMGAKLPFLHLVMLINITHTEEVNHEN